MPYPLCRFVLGLDTYRVMQRAIKPSQNALFKVDIAKCSKCTLRLLRSTPHPLSTSSAVRLLHVERAAGLDPRQYLFGDKWESLTNQTSFAKILTTD